MAICWEVLGLDKEKADEKSVKRAYARALKQNRPDRDPEGFREVREAYESALNYLAHRPEDVAFFPKDGNAITFETGSEKEDDEGREEETPEALAGHRAATAARSVEFLSAGDDLEALLRSGDAASDDLGAAMKAFHDAAMEDQPGGLSAWGSELWSLCDGEDTAHEIARHLSNDQLIHELENDTNVATRLAINAWSDHGDHQRLVALAKVIIKKKDRLRNPVAAGAMAQLANFLGIVDRFRAELLLDLAYPLLPPDSRGFLTAGAEEWIAYGRLFHAIPTPQAAFWDQRFRRRWGGEEFDWTSAPARAAIDDLTNSGRVTQPMLDVLEEVVPEDVFNEVRRDLRWEAPTPQPGPPTAPDPSNAGRLIWMALIVLFVITWLIRSISNNSPEGFSTSIGEFPELDDMGQTYQVNNLMDELIVSDPAVQVLIDQVKADGIIASLSVLRDGGDLGKGSRGHRQALFHLVRDKDLPANERALLPEIVTETFDVYALRSFDFSLGSLELPVLLALETELAPYRMETLTFGEGEEVSIGFKGLEVFKKRLKARIRMLSAKSDPETPELEP